MKGLLRNAAAGMHELADEVYTIMSTLDHLLSPDSGLGLQEPYTLRPTKGFGLATYFKLLSPDMRANGLGLWGHWGVHGS